MKNKKVLAFALTAVFALGINLGTAQAATKKITDVNLTITADIVSGDLVADQQAEVTAKTSKINVGDCVFFNDEFRWTDTDIPRMEVKLYAEDGYYFSTYDTSYTIVGGTYVKQKREDFSKTLTVTIDLPPVNEFTQKIQEAYWSDDHTASWRKSSGAGRYEVKLYRNGKRMGNVDTTEETSLDLRDALTKPGTYFFRVRPMNKINPQNSGEWVESSSRSVNESMAQANRLTNKEEGIFQRNETGWWYENSDGTFPVNSWKKVNKKWYYFDARGYMKTGWISWNQKQYYCDEESGQMLFSCITPDGATVGEDGAKNP
ncbi:cell wall-binding protein [Clostridium sp. E02]|uniref:cell wall-binding protein n=1 Tax=Clostridium sp. E02 TaxID=2487134 RepID=UPI000F528FD8|nr:cell wall-binding protein [Clostridium sp. E02]